ncbi:TonB-dependent receptor [Colwellia sp. MB02u-18]|uniref:TonB-dependent receptor n=1 Tax=unclassified Colwellia TaxID=196834 RepID=UPI0015F62262|nr:MULTISPECIES: TonB-dependent receptor [unclassified Colwellia]MBA6223538.1 TonB-dependent receptor [Colwellia sp. MB3u-45]MBA6269105.1 TonB-dependent receptor [Colwellia sp. MB3u-43]MBA6320809.1 TonB-dependent receptor [Colwellia sp. MB02u-19]MBA6324021.1 TonB-dependent receptor [Colwellia sp. MB02u-18]MBA6330957.1 TonB-dependent receptor [Colwellia sp. MB02u-12]
MKHCNLRLSVLAITISAALTSQSILAAAANEQLNNDPTLERIEVTARKSLESLQSVPVAITSIGAEQLAQNGISVMTEVQQFSPNTTLQASRGTNSTLTAFIRGVGQDDPLWGYEPGVGIYVDDVYIARPQGAVLDILDVERIEVLRGPQGSLYGKNTIGGAIKYVTKKMSGDVELDLKGTFGTYDRKDYKVAGKVPVIADKLYLGFALADLKRGGYGEFLQSSLPGQNLENYNKDIFAGRLTIEFEPTEDLFLRFNYDKTIDDSNAKGGYRLLPSIVTNAPVPNSVYDSYTSMPTWNSVESEGFSLTAEYMINDTWSVKSITSSRDNYSKTNIDFDNTAERIFDVPAIYDDEQFTQEFQLNYNSDNLNFVSGLYYFDGESCGHFDAILENFGKSLALPGLTREVTGCNNSESYAVYAQGSFNITDKFSMTLGARYTKEEKIAKVNNGVVFETVYPESGWVNGYERGDVQFPEVLNDKEDWSRFTPRVGAEYQYSDDMMFFASYSQGFKSGTFNPRASGPEPAVDPEVVDSFEVGLKSEWNNNLRVNATAFYLDHKDRQFVTVLPTADNSALSQRLGNIGTSTASGLELEIEYAVADNLNVFASLGLIDSSFDEVTSFDNDGNQIDISDSFTITNTPETTANLGFTYNIDTSVGSFVVNSNYYYRSEYDLNVTENLLTQDGYGLLNFGVNWYSNNGDWTAALHWKNITDKEYLVGNYAFLGAQNNDGSYQPGLGGDTTLIGYYGDPETLALTIGYSF